MNKKKRERRNETIYLRKEVVTQFLDGIYGERSHAQLVLVEEEQVLLLQPPIIRICTLYVQ
jgi:hypothetical protein